MILFQALTPWTLSNQDGALFVEPALASNYSLAAWSDVTGQAASNLLPEPNLFAVQAQTDEQTFAAIQADTRYLVLWSKQIAET